MHSTFDNPKRSYSTSNVSCLPVRKTILRVTGYGVDFLLVMTVMVCAQVVVTAVMVCAQSRGPHRVVWGMLTVFYRSHRKTPQL